MKKIIVLAILVFSNSTFAGEKPKDQVKNEKIGAAINLQLQNDLQHQNRVNQSATQTAKRRNKSDKKAIGNIKP